jgi:hypothetical protein
MTDRALRVLEEIADVLGVDPTDIEQDVCWDDLPDLVYELDRRRARSEAEVSRLRAAVTEHRDEFIVLDLGPGPVDLDQFEAVTARDARLWAVLEEPSDG